MTGSSWPLELSGVTESIVTTLGPNDRWNVAALGLFAGEAITARTWGRTRTRHNFHERGKGYVQFTRDPVDFVEATCSIREEETPILDSADAWVRVAVESVETGADWEEWVLTPVESGVEQRVVPTTNRGYYAVIEATVAASRLDVPEYNTDELNARIDRAQSVVERCGGERERAAWDRFEELVK